MCQTGVPVWRASDSIRNDTQMNRHYASGRPAWPEGTYKVVDGKRKVHHSEVTSEGMARSADWEGVEKNWCESVRCWRLWVLTDVMCVQRKSRCVCVRQLPSIKQWIPCRQSSLQWVYQCTGQGDGNECLRWQRLISDNNLHSFFNW